MRVAIVTTFLPSSRSSGADIASMNLVTALRLAGHRVEVHGYTSPTGAPLADGEHAVGPCTGEWNRSTTTTRMRWVLKALLHGRAVASEKFVTFEYARILPDIAARNDAWVLDHHYLDWLRPPCRMPCVAVVHNIEHALISDRADHSGALTRPLLRRDAKLMRLSEEQVLRSVDAAWCFSDTDARTIAHLHPSASCVPLCGVDPGEAPPPSKVTCDTAMLGLWTWEPNRRGLEWFLREVLPLLPRDFRIAIGGRGTDGLPADPRVSYLGFVPDAMSFLRSSRILAIPSIAGGGVQIKSINALNLGIGTVATRFAMRGLDVPGWATLADTPAEMAQALIAARAKPLWDPHAGRAWYAKRLEALADILDRDLHRITRN